jgi:hypothetical protein
MKDCKHSSDVFNDLMEIIHLYIKIYQCFVLKLIRNDNDNDNAVPLLYEITHISKKINTIHDKQKIHSLFNIIEKMYYSIHDINTFFEINYFIIKKINKNHIIIDNILENIKNEEFQTKLNESQNKFLNWLITI